MGVSLFYIYINFHLFFSNGHKNRLCIIQANSMNRLWKKYLYSILGQKTQFEIASYAASDSLAYSILSLTYFRLKTVSTRLLFDHKVFWIRTIVNPQPADQLDVNDVTHERSVHRSSPKLMWARYRLTVEFNGCRKECNMRLIGVEISVRIKEDFRFDQW